MVHSSSPSSPTAHYMRLAKCYMRGRGGYARDYEQALHYYDLAAQQGDVDALYALGKCYLKGVGCLKDEAGAVSCLERAAYRGHRAAALKLAECFRQGWGAPVSESLACYWELRALARQ